MEPSIKVTRVGTRWHARMLVGGVVRDEMACQLREDIGWICREMLRWYQKMGGASRFAAAARKRQISGAKGRVWWRGSLEAQAQRRALDKVAKFRQQLAA